MKRCPFWKDKKEQKDCEHYEPRKEKPQTAADWTCLYFRRLDGDNAINWCDAMYPEK